jgi:hypothetical protein
MTGYNSNPPLLYVHTINYCVIEFTNKGKKGS